MRERDAVADARRAERLAGQEHRQKCLTVVLIAKRQFREDAAKDRRLITAGDAADNPAALQGIIQSRSGSGRGTKRRCGNLDLIGRCPVEKLNLVKPALAVDLAGGERAGRDPLVNRVFGHFQNVSNVANGKQHGKRSQPWGYRWYITALETCLRGFDAKLPAKLMSDVFRVKCPRLIRVIRPLDNRTPVREYRELVLLHN